MKRPLVCAAAGFVLGEVWLLLPVSLQAAVPVILAAGTCLLWAKERIPEHGRGSGRSLIARALPFLFCCALGAGRLAADQRQTEEYERTAEAVKDETLRLEGRIGDIREGNGDSYEAVLELYEVALGQTGGEERSDGERPESGKGRESGEPESGGGRERGGRPESGESWGSGEPGSGKGRESGRKPEDAKDQGYKNGRESGKGHERGEPPKSWKARESGEGRGFGNVLVYLKEIPGAGDGRPGPADLRIGMKVSVRGKLKRMGRAGNPGEFDYSRYYHTIGVEGRVFGEDLRIESAEYSPYRDMIVRGKRWAIDRLRRICSEKDLGIFQAAVLGDRSALSDDIRDLYQKNGISHLLAVSGLHVSLIGLGFYHLLRRRGTGFGTAGGLAAALTVTYGIMTGGSASVVRAVFMVCLRLLADKLGRTYDMLSAMAAAALLLLWQSPALLFEAGFQLSFGAIIAIGAAGPPLTAWLKMKSAFGRTVITGIAIQMVTYPVILWHYFEYPVYGVLLNLLVVPLMGYVLVSGLTGILVSTVSVSAGQFAVGTGHYILIFYEWLCRLAGRMPGAVYAAGRPRLWQIGIYAVVWCLILYRIRRAGAGNRENWRETALGQEIGQEPDRRGEPRSDKTAPGQEPDRRGEPRSDKTAPGQEPDHCGEPHLGRMVRRVKDQRLNGGARGEEEQRPDRMARLWRGAGKYLIFAWAVFFGCRALGPLPVSGFSAVFLDVGQGDGICLESGDMTVLVDGGSGDKKNVGEQILEPFLKSRGIRHVDYAVISHGDEDHVSGVRYLLEEDSGIAIGCLVLPDLGRTDEKYERLTEAAQKAQVPVFWMKAGDEIRAVLPDRKSAGHRGMSGKREDAGYREVSGEREDAGYREVSGEREDAEYWGMAVRQEGEGARPLSAGQPGDGMVIRCLYAGDAGHNLDTNDHSLLLEVSYGQARILLTGDLSSEGERRWMEGQAAAGTGPDLQEGRVDPETGAQLQKGRVGPETGAQLQEGRVNPETGAQTRENQAAAGAAALPLSGPVHVLKAAHHGSDYSSCEEFLKLTDPVWTVISCGEGNRYGHPGKETMGRLTAQGSECFLTTERGAVTVRTDGENIMISGYGRR